MLEECSERLRLRRMMLREDDGKREVEEGRNEWRGSSGLYARS